MLVMYLPWIIEKHKIRRSHTRPPERMIFASRARVPFNVVTVRASTETALPVFHVSVFSKLSSWMWSRRFPSPPARLRYPA